MSTLHAPDFPEEAIRLRARLGTAAAFPERADYGHTLFGATAYEPADLIDQWRLVPPVFVPRRLEKLIDLGREPVYPDVELATEIGGFLARLPVYVSAFGPSTDLGVAISAAAARAGVPMVIGEDNGTGPDVLLAQLRAYVEQAPRGLGGVVVQQATEDADAEIWNLTYSDPTATALLDTGRLAFELKLGQGAKPGLGAMTVVPAETDTNGYTVDETFGTDVVRSGSPGTYTDEILRQQIRLMRNNYPRVRIWVKLPPARDVGVAAAVAWAAGANAVTIDGAEAGTGWAPLGFMDHVGLPLAECLRRIGAPQGGLLASGRMWSGPRAVKTLAMGATAIGLGRAALIAADEDRQSGLERLLECLALELKLLISALGKYTPAALGGEDIWLPNGGMPSGQRGARSHEYPYG
ncbi:MAG TPA: glutamate synthase-related protein [Pseudonocardiaceae bacterium]|jgi:hypothetical protein|nr:glutamate synthase-related protein [Pseudonocardiaceae bacterium]